jgi:hypothetical protein
MPGALATQAIVDAVPIVMQCPFERAMQPSATCESLAAHPGPVQHAGPALGREPVRTPPRLLAVLGSLLARSAPAVLGVLGVLAVLGVLGVRHRDHAHIHPPSTIQF